MHSKVLARTHAARLSLVFSTTLHGVGGMGWELGLGQSVSHIGHAEPEVKWESRRHSLEPCNVLPHDCPPRPAAPPSQQGLTAGPQEWLLSGKYHISRLRGVSCAENVGKGLTKRKHKSFQDPEGHSALINTAVPLDPMLSQGLEGQNLFLQRKLCGIPRLKIQGYL